MKTKQMSKKKKVNIDKISKGIARKLFFEQDGNTLAKYFGANHKHLSEKEKQKHRRYNKTTDDY